MFGYEVKIVELCFALRLCYTYSTPVFPHMNSIGGESLAVAQNTFAVNWFKGKELNLVFGLQLSMARLVGIPDLIRFICTVNIGF